MGALHWHQEQAKVAYGSAYDEMWAGLKDEDSLVRMGFSFQSDIDSKDQAVVDENQMMADLLLDYLTCVTVNDLAFNRFYSGRLPGRFGL